MSSPRNKRESLLNAETVEHQGLALSADVERRVALTILHHPEVARAGEVAVLDLAEGTTRREASLSRIEPDFFPVRSTDGFPLADPFISRQPVRISLPAGGGLTLARDKGAAALSADGAAVEAELHLQEERLDAGVVLEYGQRVVLLLHRRPLPSIDEDDLGLIGENAEMYRLRQDILRVANMPVPVLLRGETGTGKELVAQAIHRAGKRADRPCLSVNMAAIPWSVAASELFGHVKGAFTGATEDHSGYFQRANGGTLFLDEIGETPVEVQVVLLRTLETGIVQPVGGRKETAVDVRLVTATDADLEGAVREGRFRPALLHRLAGYEIHLPPLRERRDDIGRLLVHFLRGELEALDRSDRLVLGDASARPWLGSSVVARLAAYDWPGNVRQLRNVARHIVIANADAPEVRFDRALERLLEEEPAARPAAAAEPASKEKPGPRRKPADVSDQELVEALERNRWRIEQAAADLNVSRASIYMLIEKHPGLRKAKDISKEELATAYQAAGGDLDRMSELLKVSKGGLRLRIKELGQG